MLMQLILDKKTESLLHFRLSLGYRLVFTAIVVALTLGMITLETYSWLAFLVLGISVFALLYNERWVFDTEEGYMEHHFGLVFLYKKTRFDLSEALAVEVEKIDRGKPMSNIMVSGSLTGKGEGKANREGREQAHDYAVSGNSGSLPSMGIPKKRSILSPALFTRLILILKSEKPKSLETIKTRNPAELVRKGEDLADFLDLPFHNRT